jgi:glycosyltransferase involved in cell wall biosynthesis
LRIAIVSDAWRPQINGVVRTIETVAQLLRAQGHDVGVFGPDRFRTLPCPTYPEIRLSLFPAARLDHMLKLYAPDAIHLVTEGPLGWAARAFCLRRAIPFTSAYHTRFPEYVRARIRVPLSWSYARVPLPRALGGGAGGCAVGSATSSASAAATWRHGRAASTSQPSTRVRMRRPEARPISALCRPRGDREDIKAFSISTCPAPNGWWAAGPQLKELKRRYTDVCFFGSVDTEELSRRYAEADCFVFPSRTDTFGLVMVEALASGVPVAGYPVPGPLDVATVPGVGAVDEDLRTACLAAVQGDPRLPAPCRELHLGKLCRAVPRHPAPHPAQRLAADEAPRAARRGGVRGRGSVPRRT